MVVTLCTSTDWAVFETISLLVFMNVLYSGPPSLFISNGILFHKLQISHQPM